MENKELIEQIKAVTSQISDLDKTRNELQETLKNQCGFSIGEKVKVFERIDQQQIERGFGYVKKISVNSQGEIKFVLFKEKKDGQPSSNVFSKNDRYIIEKI